MAWGAPNNYQQYQANQANQQFNSNYQALLAANGPTIAQGQLAQNAGIRNIGYAGQQYGLQSADQRLTYEGQMGDLATQMGSNAIDLSAAQRLDPYYEKLLALTGFQRFVEQGANELTRDRNLSDTDSAATANGATQSRGLRQQHGFIQQDFQNSEAMSKISNAKEIGGLEEQRAQAKDRAAQLELEARNLGTKPDLLRRQLDNSLAQLGLNNAMSVDDILDGLAKGNLDMLQLYNNLIQQAGTYTSVAGK